MLSWFRRVSGLLRRKSFEQLGREYSFLWQSSLNEWKYDFVVHIGKMQFVQGVGELVR